MKKLEEKPRAVFVLEILPKKIADEILRLSACRPGGISAIKEISVRLGGGCYLKIGREEIRLFSFPDWIITQTISPRAKRQRIPPNTISTVVIITPPNQNRI